MNSNAPSLNENNQTFMSKLKEFFSDIPSEEDQQQFKFFNEASIYIPQKQVLYIEPKKFQQLNHTMPVVCTNKHQFSIDDEDTPGKEEMFETEITYDQIKMPTRASQLQQQSNQVVQVPQNLHFEGFDEIDVRPLIKPTIVDKVSPQRDPYTKGSIINYPPLSTFKITKTPRKYERFLDYILGSISREIIIDGGWIYFVKKQQQDKFLVCSCTPLDRLFKILIKRDELKPPIKIAFTNDGKNIYMLPRIKEFKLINKDQQDLFFIKLRSEVQKYGYDLYFK